MKEPTSLYMQLDENMRKKVNKFLQNIFKYNDGIIHPFLDELARIKQEELAQVILRKRGNNV
ncbi:MAG: hypothetical protein GX801_06925 [Fibrobacter sp.]|nr:hypothetical protein [Fibrobacter sp.]